jgi:hypothetical protein
MANTDKNIVITPNKGQAADPQIAFSGADGSSGPFTLKLKVYADGTIGFEGSSGQLFSISDDMTGTIFSANDISGIPSIEVLADGTVKFAEFGGNVGVGVAVPAATFDVGGTSAAKMPVGTTGQRPTGVTGMIRFNTTSGMYETYNGSAWVSGLGYTGSQGVIGYTGSQGIIGFVGSQGTQGIQGVIGYTGSQGSTGFVGSQGAQGVIGYTGSRGIVGFTGSSAPGTGWTPVKTGTITQTGGTTFTKTSGSVAWDAQVYSQEGYANSAYVSWQVTNQNMRVMVGLDESPTDDANYTSLDFGIYADSTSLYRVNSGSLTLLANTYNTNTVMAIVYDGNTISMQVDGVELYSVIRAVGNPLYLDSSFYDASSWGIKNVRFGGSNFPASNAPALYTKGFTGSQGATGGTGGTGYTGSQGPTSGWTLVSTLTASSSTTLDYNSLSASSYKHYMMVFRGVKNATNTTYPYLKFTADGGSSYAANIVAQIIDTNNGGTVTVATTTNNTLLNFGGAGGYTQQNSDDTRLFGIVYLTYPINSSNHFSFHGTLWYRNTIDAAGICHSEVSGYWTNATQPNGVRFMYSSGNITEGEIRIYGLA